MKSKRYVAKANSRTVYFVNRKSWRKAIAEEITVGILCVAVVVENIGKVLEGRALFWSVFLKGEG